MFPPHTRGSTFEAGISMRATGVSPAHAGIDLSNQESQRADARFPRTRGDRPELNTAGLDPQEFPPHTRGSTQHGCGAISL